MTDTLDDLVVDEEEVNESLLTETLSDYVRIGMQSGSMMPQEEFQSLNSRRKVAVILLTQKARTELDQIEGVESEWMTPKEISEQGGIKTGTVHPAVRQLEDDGIAENVDGSYRIPTPNLEQTKQYIEGG